MTDIRTEKIPVAPLAGAWIETICACSCSCSLWSRPSRARGLKLAGVMIVVAVAAVAPLAGAWIETQNPARLRDTEADGRAPRGRVD